MGANVDAQKRTASAMGGGQDVEKTSPAPVQPVEDKEEPTFDTGLACWLQVLGSWFLFFNSWCVEPNDLVFILKEGRF
jgi:hypothetical protein